ncbi:MAG TPA: NAD(P)-dependent oxidoreductase [Conexibacter sp.]|nr:NAD(P)-dependent oxidoreductase [Conexibacter sp.]
MSGASVVLAEGPLPGPAFAQLANVELAGRPLGEHVVAPRPDVGALIALGGAVDAALLDRLPNLRVVARFGVGYDAVDVAACSERGVQVAITPGPVEDATAELTVALILALRRRVLAADRLVRGGGWSSPVTAAPSERGIHDATIGFVGFGRIARRVALATAALGATILYTARNRVAEEVEATVGARRVALAELCASSDVVTVHCPLTDATRGLIGARELALMRDGAALVNTARGPIVDEAALVAQVVAGRLEAALDVFAHEPDVPLGLRASRHVVLSPHVGSATRSAREQMTRICVENVRAALAGERAPHLVPEQA